MTRLYQRSKILIMQQPGEHTLQNTRHTDRSQSTSESQMQNLGGKK